MPQGRRKTPFSGKAKKEQLKSKKHTKSGTSGAKKGFLAEKSTHDESGDEILKIHHQPGATKPRSYSNRYALQFHKETDAELKLLKEAAYEEITSVHESDLEIKADDFFCEKLEFPQRPHWSYTMSTSQLESHEQKYFHEYVSNIERLFSWKELGYFELNLETWRQLWRVLEMSDIILFIVDIRYPAAMFPPSLYSYVKSQNKEMILVLNKIDLAPASLVVAWQHYFKEKYSDLHILLFTTFPGYNLRGNTSDKGGLQTRKRKGRLRMAAEGAQKLLEVCKSIVGCQVDLSAWQTKINEEKSANYDHLEPEINEQILVKNDTSFIKHEKFKDNILTIGCVGQPNVGKSSLLNAVMGKKVVSVSRTPGHTKHFQTIFLTSNVRLCDCPGLVFPSKTPKNLQILIGTFPIAQLRQPYSAISYIASRINLPVLLRIQHPEGDDCWSAMDICEAWAKKRGYLTAKAARPDTYRAANSLLRMQLEGKICLCLNPNSYSKLKDKWSAHEDIETVRWIQAQIGDSDEQACASTALTDSSDGEEDDVEDTSSNGNQISSEHDSDEAQLSTKNPYAVLMDNS